MEKSRRLGYLHLRKPPPNPTHSIMRIIEDSVFGHRSRKRHLVTKRKKNAFRASLVRVCSANFIISLFGVSDLDVLVLSSPIVPRQFLGITFPRLIL